MSQLRTLLKQSSHYMMGRGLALAIGFVSFPITARLFSVADYGIVNLAQRFTLFAVAVSKLGLQNSILRLHEECASSEKSLGRLYATCWYGSFAGALVGALVCAGFFALAPPDWIQPAVARALLFASGLVFVRSSVSPINGFLRVEGRTVAYNTLDVLQRILSLVLGVGLVLTLGRRPESFLLGLIVAEGLVLAAAVVFLVPRSRLAPSHFDTSLLRSSLHFGIPLAGSELGTTLLGSADRMFVQYFLGSQPLGYYAAACAMAITLQEVIQVPLNLALVPIYVKIWHTEGPEATSRFVSRILDLFLIAACGVCALVLAASRELIVFVSSAKFEPAAALLGPLVIGYMFFAASVFLTAGYWVQKQTRKMAKLVVWALAVKCILNVVLLPRIGLWGAVIPNVAGFVLLACLYGWCSRDLLAIHISWGRLLVYAGAGAVAALAGRSVMLGPLLGSLVLRASVCVAVYAGLIWLADARVRGWTGQLARKWRG